MGTSKFLHAALAAALAATVAACDRQQTAEVNRKAESVGQKIDGALDRTKQELAQAGDKLQPKLANAGERISEAGNKVAATVKEETSSRAVADTAITASIKTDFIKDPDLSVLKIDVDTKDGVVTLNGLAGNAEAKTRAEKIAGAIKGVKQVRNFLTVKQA